MKRVIDETTPLLDIAEKSPQAIEFFEKLGNSLGECIMCKHLFDPLGKVAEMYSLDKDKLIDSIKNLLSEEKV